MIETIAKRVALNLQDKNDFDSDLYEVHIYGVEIAISSVINILITALLALCFGRPLDALVYLICTRPLRKYGGGWHSKTHMLCITLHSLSFSLISWASFLLQQYITAWMLILGYVMVLTVVIAKAPSEHPNNPVFPSERQKMRIKCLAVALASAVLSLIAQALGYSHFAALMMLGSVSAACTLLIPGKLLA